PKRSATSSNALPKVARSSVFWSGRLGGHWVFQFSKRLSILIIRNPNSHIQNPIDAFLLVALVRKGFSFSPEANRRAFLRRVTYDLIGLPPTPQEMEAFLADRRPDAYERVVDRLLNDPRYGER